MQAVRALNVPVRADFYWTVTRNRARPTALRGTSDVALRMIDAYQSTGNVVCIYRLSFKLFAVSILVIVVLNPTIKDGEKDCKDGSDEQDCPPRVCPAGVFQCNNTRCVGFNQICNGFDNCQDESDEKLCADACPPGRFQCPISKRCIPVSLPPINFRLLHSNVYMCLSFRYRRVEFVTEEMIVAIWLLLTSKTAPTSLVHLTNSVVIADIVSSLHHENSIKLIDFLNFLFTLDFSGIDASYFCDEGNFWISISFRYF